MDPFSRPAPMVWNNEIHVSEVVTILKEDTCLLERKEEFARMLGNANDEILDIMNSPEKNSSKCLDNILSKYVSGCGMSVTIAELRAVLRDMKLKYLEERLGIYVDETRIVLAHIPLNRNARPFAELQESPPRYTAQNDITMDDLSSRFVNATIKTPKYADENEMVSKFVLENIPESNEQEDFQVVVKILSFVGITEIIDEGEITHKRVIPRSGFLGNLNPYARKPTTTRQLKVNIRQSPKTGNQRRLSTQRICKCINKNKIMKAAGINAKPA